MQRVEFLHEWATLYGARRGGGKRHRLAAWAHARLYHVDQSQHVALAIGIGRTAELVGATQLRKHTILGLASGR